MQTSACIFCYRIFNPILASMLYNLFNFAVQRLTVWLHGVQMCLNLVQTLAEDRFSNQRPWPFLCPFSLGNSCRAKIFTSATTQCTGHYRWSGIVGLQWQHLCMANCDSFFFLYMWLLQQCIYQTDQAWVLVSIDCWTNSAFCSCTAQQKPRVKSILVKQKQPLIERLHNWPVP